jgi:hypothetical protein
MRMRVPSRVRDERGVTGAIVAISLVVMLGMLALGVDMGFMMAKRRSMVNANDSAALAFAESCALKEGLAAAEVKAPELAAANATNAAEAEPYVLTGDCDGKGEVTVHYQGQQSLFFAPIVGLDSSVTVSARATAIWGPAGGAGSVVPLMMSMGRLTDCDIPNAVPGTVCYFYVNNKDIGDAEWGLLNVQPNPTEPKFGWDVEDVNYNCPSFSAEEIRDIIENGSPDNLAIDYPEPTYVCRVPGVKAADFMAVEELEGTVRMFPVNDPNGQILRGGAPAPPPMTPDFYDIVGFAQLLIENVMRGNDADWDPNCPGAADANAFCLKVVWQGYSTSPGPPCLECPDFGVSSIGLKG